MQTKEKSPFVPMKPAFRLLVLLFFASYWLLTSICAVVNQAPAAEWIIPALFFYIVVIAIPIIFYKSSYGWSHPLVFGAIMFGSGLLRSFPAYAWGLDWHQALPNHDSEQLTQLLAYYLFLQSIGLLAYYFGFHQAPLIAIPRLSFGQPRQIGIRMAFVIVLTGTLFLIYIYQKGGINTHMLSWSQSRHVALAGEFYLLSFIPVGAYACITWFTLNPKAIRLPFFWFCAIASLAMIFLSTGSRGGVLGIGIIGLIIWVLRNQRIPFGKLLPLLLVAFFILSTLGQLRSSIYQGEVDWTTLIPNSPVQDTSTIAVDELVSRSTTGLGVLPILAHVPDQVDFLYGESYLAVLTLPIPRGLWVWGEKPGLIGGRVGETFFYGRGGIPPGAVGEAYWNFYIHGVVLLFFLFGQFHKWLVKVMERYADQPTVMILYAITLWSLSPTSMGVVQWLLVCLPVYVLLISLGVLARKRRTLAPLKFSGR